VGSVFGPIRFLLPVCWLCWFLYTLNIYMLIFRHIFLSNYWWQKSDIWSQASYRYPISWEAFFGPIRFLLPICRFCWFLYTFNIHLYMYMHIFRRIVLSNYWWQESDIWSQASYMYAILWEVFLDPWPSDSYFLFADFVDFYTHWTYILYMPIFSHIFSATIDGRNLIFGTPYRGKRLLTCQIPTSCLPKSGGIISEH
jgi:hypothetical protein